LPTFSDLMAEIETSGVPVNQELNDDLDGNNLEGTADDDLGGEESEDSDNDADATTGDDLGFNPNSITDPALLAQYKAMQASFTPRLQEAAKIKEQYGGLDPVVVDAVRQYQTLMQSDPRAAAEFLGQQRQWLEQQHNLTQPADPFDGVEPLTPGEEVFLRVARDLWQQQQSMQYENQQLKLSRQQEAAERQFAQIESRYKTPVPMEEKQQVWAYMQQTGIKDVEAAWKVLNFDKLASKAAVKTAATAAQKKKQPPPPTNRQQRSATPTGSAKGKGIASHFEDAWSQFSRD
jgi:acyl-CoA thioesterase FadM